MSVPIVLEHIVSPEQHGWTLRRILRTNMALSRTLLAGLRQQKNAIAVNGQPRWMDDTLSLFDHITVTLREDTPSTIVPEPMPLHILDEDDHLLVLLKPAGAIVHPTHGHYTQTIANGVMHHWHTQGIARTFRPIHRLDHDTSGVLVVAKNQYAHAYVAKQFHTNTLTKTYTAIVHGVVACPHGIIDLPISRDPVAPHRRLVTPTGQHARTHFVVTQRLRRATVVRLHPITGRTHQLRVHLATLHHPIVGDCFYGREFSVDASPAAPPLIARQALHATAMTFHHPHTKKAVTYTAPLPADMVACLAQLQ